MKPRMWCEDGVWLLDMVCNGSPPSSGSPQYLTGVLWFFLQGVEMDRLEAARKGGVAVTSHLSHPRSQPITSRSQQGDHE